jgi:transcriptional regulator with XRE-family HTH domain
MTAQEFLSIRKYLGLSQRELSDRLGLGEHGNRTVQRIEKGATISGPMSLAMERLRDLGQ